MQESSGVLDRHCFFSTRALSTITPRHQKLKLSFPLDVETVTQECDGVRKQFDIHLSVRYGIL